MSICDTCCHQFSDICGGCETLEGVPVKYSEKPKASTLPDELTPYAVELITRCPHLINLFADKINRMLGDWGMERLEPIQLDSNHLTCDIQDLLSHVGYDAAQCGYDK